MKQLVVIIDEESRRTLEGIGFRYFSAGKRRNDRDFIIETPMGVERRVRGTLVRNPRLNEHTSEYLYLPATDYCNFHCHDCGVSEDLVNVNNRAIVYPDARYMTSEFVAKLADRARRSPFQINRKLFYGGGEPLINPKEFGRLRSQLDGLERTIHVVVTNGCNVPLDFEEFRGYMQKIGNPCIIFSLKRAQMEQYADLVRSGNGELAGRIPLDVEPEEAIFKKILLIAKHAERLGIGFTVNHVVERKTKKPGPDYGLSDKLRAAGVEVYKTILYGFRDVCSKSQETSLRSNGDIYPHCYDVFSKTNKLGVIGLLLE